VPKPSKGRSRQANNGSTPARQNGNGALRVDLQVQDLEVLVRACQRYRASLPSYLVSAQPDYTRAQALIEQLGQLIPRGDD
jgi:hypothetical protein